MENLKIADEVLRNPADTCCRRGLIGFLQEKYQQIETLNNSWGSSFDSFDALQNPIEKCSEEYPGSFDDIREYSRFLVREYIRIPSEACRKTDRNHLNLGFRWSKADNPDMMVGWEYFDVFSINCYDFDPSTDMDFVKNAGVDLPILLGEYHCGALDRGLPATGLKGVENQTERAIMWSMRQPIPMASAPTGSSITINSAWEDLTGKIIRSEWWTYVCSRIRN